MLKAAGAQALAPALRWLPYLQDLCLQHNELDDEGLLYLSEPVGRLSALTSLDYQTTISVSRAWPL